MRMHKSFGIVLALSLAILSMGPEGVLAQPSEIDRRFVEECWRGNMEQDAALLAQGANPNAKRFGGRSALSLAADHGHLKVMRLLIDKGADPNARDDSGRTALLEAAGSREPLAVKMLLDAGAKLDNAALGQACWLGREESVRLLLDAGIHPDAGLVKAAQGGHAKLVRLLLDRGANPSARSRLGNTALHTGSLQGGAEVVKILLASGADPNLANDEGKTPLHMAVSGNRELETVKLLVQGGAKLNLPDKDGITPVRQAGRGSTQPLYDWLVAAAGGKEPLAWRSEAERQREEKRTTRELIALFTSEAPTAEARSARQAAQRELLARGKANMSDLLATIDAGTPAERFGELYVAMGPDAEAAIPKLTALFRDKDRVSHAAGLINRIQRNAFANLPREVQQTAADTLYQAAIGLDSPDEGIFAATYIQSLIYLGPISIPYLPKLLRSTDPKRRQATAEMLGYVRFSSIEAQAVLMELAERDPDYVVRRDAVFALGAFGEPTGEVKATLLAIMKLPPPVDERQLTPFDQQKKRQLEQWRELADRAARSLARFGPDVIGDLIPLLSPITASQRGPGMTALVSIGAPAVPRLIELLAHDDPAVAISASVALNRIKQPAVPALAKALSTGNDQVTTHAASALWWIGPGAKDALPALLEVAGAENRSDASRLVTARAALKVDPKSRESTAILSVVPVLIRILEKGTFQQQGWAAETACGIGSPARSALPMLRMRLELPAENIDTGGLVRGYVQQEAKAAITAIESALANEPEKVP